MKNLFCLFNGLGCYHYRCLVGSYFATFAPSKQPPLYKHWSDKLKTSDDLANYLIKQIVAWNEDFVLLNKPVNISVWGQSLSRIEALKLVYPHASFYCLKCL